MIWTKPCYETHNCGMEVSMYSPDEEGEVLFRVTCLNEERTEEAVRPYEREIES
jgi:coenzyme PQQ precursor peptide PqqA